MSKRASMQMIFVVLTAVAATVALLIGGSEMRNGSSVSSNTNRETLQGRVLP